jgi:hypothetical protein
MFSKRVLLILGAGASAEFGLPIGSSLKEGIANDSRFFFDKGQLRDGDALLYATMQAQCPEPNRVLILGRELANVLSLHYTVDEALHYLSSSPESIMMGKMAIVTRIIKGEHKSSLNSAGDHKANLQQTSNTWVHHFLSIAVAGATKENIARCLESVTVINFNYDRALEHYLYWAIQRYGCVEAEVAKAALRQMRIIRPYGSLGKLEWEDHHHGLRYGDADEAARDPMRYAKNIRTFTEQCEEGIPQAIDDAINEAQLILFLGFGFHHQNLQLFKPSSRDLRQRYVPVYCTAVGLDEANYSLIRSTLDSYLIRQGGIAQLHAWTANDLLMKLRPTIETAARN